MASWVKPKGHRMEAPRRYRPTDGEVGDLDGLRVAIVGYGNLGQPAALNLRDSGIEVVVGSRDDEDGGRARGEGFHVLPIREALQAADIAWIALPDEVMSEVLDPLWGDAILRPGSMVCFASGYPLVYSQMALPGAVDVALLAPRMIGRRMRSRFLEGAGFYSFVSVVKDESGYAAKRLLGLAKGVGTLQGTRCSGAFDVAPEVEAALDLFVEQTVGPILGAAVISAFGVGCKGGLPASALALELYMSGEMGATWETFAERGFFSGVRDHGYTAAFGGLLRLGDLDMEEMHQRFESILEDIVSEGFADKLQDDLSNGAPTRMVVEDILRGDDGLSAAERSLGIAL